MEMDNNYKTVNPAVDFLLFSYFGITSDSGKEEMIYACIKRAYLDTCRTITFPARKDFKKDDAKGQYFYEHTGKIIYNRVNDLSTGTDYDLWHKKTCESVMTAGKDPMVQSFYGDAILLSCGHAQKWVNMTMKYLYLLEQLIGKGYVSCDWSKLHVPVDRYIIEATGKETASILGTSTWSSIDDWDNYTKYQEAIRELAETPPIDWEGPAWIKIAKMRAETENKKKQERLEVLITACKDT